jgi:hypothetical protein
MTGRRGRFRLLIALGLLASVVAIGGVAGAHSCSASANPPVDNGNTISGFGQIDCDAGLAGDVLTVKVWRRIDFAPDDFWVQVQDGFPANGAGFRYFGTATGCEAGDPPDDFLTEAVGNSSLHSLYASAINSGPLDC